MLKAKTLSCAAKAYVTKPRRRTACAHVNCDAGRASFCDELGARLLARQLKPLADCFFNRGQLVRLQAARQTNCSRRRNGNEALGVECSLLQKRAGNNGFEFRFTCRRGVWNKSNQRAIRVTDSRADDEAGPDLCGEPKINEPDLAPFGIFHSSSCLSYARNTSSAAARSSSSETAG